MPFSGYNDAPTNAIFEVNKYADAYGKVGGVGCDGTTLGSDAAKPTYSSPFVGGGYSFTDKPVAVAGPGAPYSVTASYDNTRDLRPVFPKEFRSALTGGKKRHSRRRTQYGCSGRRQMKSKRRTTRRRHLKKRRTTRSRHLKKRRTTRRRTMRGGMTSASDFTEGRNTSQDIPYGNNAHSFGQGLSVMLNTDEIGMASPTPLTPYNNCGRP